MSSEQDGEGAAMGEQQRSVTESPRKRGLTMPDADRLADIRRFVEAYREAQRREPWSLHRMSPSPLLDDALTQIDALTTERDAATARAEALVVVNERLRTQRDTLLTEITHGGFCRLCDGFAEDGEQIVHSEDCATRFSYASRPLLGPEAPTGREGEGPER